MKHSVAIGTGIAELNSGSRTSSAAEHSRFKSVFYRNLGSTGYKVSEVGFGVYRTRNHELLHAAIDAGINYFDTAPTYMNGLCEKTLGRVLKTKRDKVFLATKVKPKNNSAREMRDIMELSLKRLQTNYVDILFMHEPNTREEFLEGHLKAFEKARKDGLCRFIGVSTHVNQVDILNVAVETKLMDAVLVGYNYHSPEKLTKAIERTRKAGLAIIAMKTQLPCKNKGYPEHREGVTPNQAALKWVLKNRYVDTTIPGMTSFEQLDEDLGVMGMKMSFNDYHELYRFGQHQKTSFCRSVSGCTGCKGTCPNGVEISQLNRCITYAYGYGNFELARENYEALPEEWRVEVCSNCEECEVQCVHGLNLTQSVHLARELFT